MPTLTLYLPGLPPVSHILRDETITIGRMKGNTIVVEDSSISLMHARITRKNGQFFLKDLNSTNGTVVNGQPVVEARLHDQDKVRFAEVSAQFYAEPALGAEPALQTGVTVPASAEAPRPVFSPPALAPVSADLSKSAPPSRPPGPVQKPLLKKGSKTLVMASLPYAAAGILVAAVSVLIFKGFSSGTQKASHVESASTMPVPVKSPKPAVDPNPRVQKPSVAAVVKPEPVAKDPEFNKGLTDPDPLERRRVVKDIHASGIQSPRQVPSLKAALKDSDEEVQMWAALALINAKVYDGETVPILVRTLKNENPTLRQVACLSLGLMPYQPAEKELVVPALAETAGKDLDDDVRNAALSALNVIAPEVVGRSLQP